MDRQQETIRSLKENWDIIINKIVNEPFRVERNQRLVRQYEELLDEYEQDGFDVSPARKYQHVGSSEAC